MKTISPESLVITFALNAECPLPWCQKNQFEVVHYKQWPDFETTKINALKQKGVVICITGVGRQCISSLHWIVDNLQPRYVLNVGSAGAFNSIDLNQWITPTTLSHDAGDHYDVDTGLPMPGFDQLGRQIKGHLITVDQAVTHHELERQTDCFVDMEAYHQLIICKHAKIHFHCVKYLTDRAAESDKKIFKHNLKRLRQDVESLLSALIAATISPDISVIIPVYNRVAWIKKCVDSVLTQTLPVSEVIVVDDGSNDGTFELLSSYHHPAMTVLRHARRKGVSAARNTGIDHSRSQWMAFLDSDDHWLPDKLAKQWRFHQQYPFYRISQTEEVWIRNGVRVNPKKIHQKPSGWIWQLSLALCLISPSAVMIHCQLFQDYGCFDETLPACEDYDLWLRLSHDCPVGLINAYEVIKYGGHDDQLSRSCVAIDQYRVQALLKALKNENDLEKRTAIQSMIAIKAEILALGFRKHHQYSEADYYAQLKMQLLQET